jgi:hypothetical protein
LVKALLYNPKGRGFDSPSSHTMALGSTEPVTEMGIRSISLRVKAADT